MIPRRKYEIRAIGHKHEPDRERIGVKIEILSGETSGASDPSPVGAVRWWNGDLSERFAEKTLEQLILLGWNGVDDGTWTGLGTTRAVGIEEEFEWPVGSGTLKRKFKFINEYYSAKPTGARLGPKYKALINKVKAETKVDPGAVITPESSDNPFG